MADEETPTGGIYEEALEFVKRYFVYEHLRKDLQIISKPLCEAAWDLLENPCYDFRELMKALDSLLAAKDAAVRAALPPK